MGLQVSEQHSAVQALLTAATATAAEKVASHASEIAAKDAAHAELALKHTDISAQVHVHLCLSCVNIMSVLFYFYVYVTVNSSVGRRNSCFGVGRGHAC